VSFEFDVESDGDGGGSLGDSNLGAFVNQKSPACPEGVEAVQGIYICKSMSKNLNDLLNQAKSDGIRLGGGGFRTLQKQIEFRNKNCSCNNNTECIYKKSSSQCTPPTAIPGKSRHQSGLAIDFTCEGQSIRARDNKCFIWMKNNANKYGFFNLPSEAWHWSVDGK
jgi:LAS superfamily LD-carboxypeptidase LdcB